MTEFIAKSGAKIVVEIAPWGDVKRLKSAIQRELAASGVKLDKEADVSSIIGAALNIDSSEAVDSALAPCLARCLRNGQKIVSSTFDSVEGRSDYYEIVKACLTENLSPLWDSLLSVLPASLLTLFKAEAKQASQENQITP